LVEIVDDDLDRILALRNLRRRRLIFRDFVGRQTLPHAIGLPDAVDMPLEDLAWVEIERNLREPSRLYVWLA